MAASRKSAVEMNIKEAPVPAIKRSPIIEMKIEEAPIPIIKKAPKNKAVNAPTPVVENKKNIKEKEKEKVREKVREKVKERDKDHEPAIIPHKHHQPQNEEIIDTSTFEHDYREIMLKYDPSNNISIPVLTDYEIPLIIGKRATQIAYGHTPLIEPRVGMNHIDIAEEELRQKKTPYIIKRQIGTRTEYWKISDLSVNF